MTRNDAQDFAQRLYARVPANYRVYDQEQGQPLLALLQVIGEQAANLRQDLDILWENFFIETCQDWAVPYIGALVGTNLLADPVGRSNRLEVRDTVSWRRNRGAPAMLQRLAQEISGWPCDLAEFFRALGWSQNLNHVRLDRALTANIRDPHALSLLGRAGDPIAHAADFKPDGDLDEARIGHHSLGIGRSEWGTTGRYQIKNLGFFVRRLQAFPVAQATPAAVDPGLAPPPNAAYFTFDPLHRELPLFVAASGAPLTRAAFNENASQFFPAEVAVRQFGVPLAGLAQPEPLPSSSNTPFTFGAVGGTVALDLTRGLRLPNPGEFKLGAVHFLIGALWRVGNTDTNLGVLSTLLAARGDAAAFRPGSSASSAGRLIITIQTGRTASGMTIPPSPAARFPGAVLALRGARAGAPHFADALYIYLPPAFVRPSDLLTYFVADDGSTYGGGGLDDASLARPSEGQVCPAFPSTQSAAPADAFQFISRTPGALRVADPSRLAGVPILIQAELFTGIFQAQGAISSIAQAAASYPKLSVPDPWPPFTFGAARDALSDNLPRTGLLAILLRPLSGSFVPSCELIIRNRRGQSLLVYLPEIADCPPSGTRVLVADDGSTWYAPAVLQQQQLLDRPARAASGQVMPISGSWPLQYRRAVALDLCRSERSTLLQPGEFGIDPELGRFAFAPSDPAIGQGDLSVDYASGFTDRVGALNYDRLLDPAQVATRLVAQTGDADTVPTPGSAAVPVYASLGAAISAAVDGDVIEITDSATYASSGEIVLNNPAVRNLTIRAAAGQRPALTFFTVSGMPTRASLRVAATAGSVAMDTFELNGLLISGGPLTIERKIARLRLQACTLDPLPGYSLAARDADTSARADYVLCRCVAGGLRLGPGVSGLTVADSIVDGQRDVAIGGLNAGSPPAFTSPPSSPPGTSAPGAASIQLERATVLGRIYCGVLSASESILDDVALVSDQQSGCMRFCRYETGSVLPRRYQCVPNEAQAATATLGRRSLAPIFNSRRFGRPDYGQLAAAGPPEILSASEQASEIGAFASAFNPIRLKNLRIKLQEFVPVGLTALIVAET